VVRDAQPLTVDAKQAIAHAEALARKVRESLKPAVTTP
jgi:hypothetical protein